jgi:hypothetical protein
MLTKREQYGLTFSKWLEPTSQKIYNLCRREVYLKPLLATLLILFVYVCFAQTDTNKLHYNHLVTEAHGDLNNDGIADKVIVTQDTLQENAPYQLLVFFVNEKGEQHISITTSKLIEPQYPNGRNGYITGTGFSGISIQKGILRVSIQLLRGHFEHAFSYQHGNFELIGFSEVYSDGNGVLTTTDFNLVTGIRKQKIERYDTTKRIRKTKRKIVITPLPKLQELIPFETEFY